MTQDEAFKAWWYNEGSQAPYTHHDCEEHTMRMCEIAWNKAQALAQPEQEPVAKNEEGRITWLVDDWPQNCFLYAEPPKWTPVEIGVDVTNEGAHVVGMYVLPDAVRYVFYSEFHSAPQRTWVGLTDEEIKALASWWPSYDQIPALMVLAKDIQNSLKEKNT